MIGAKLSKVLLKSYHIIDSLSEKCPYSELSWSAFSRVQTEHGEIFRISLYSVHMRENAEQNNSEHGHFLRSVKQTRRTKR